MLRIAALLLVLSSCAPEPYGPDDVNRDGAVVRCRIAIAQCTEIGPPVCNEIGPNVAWWAIDQGMWVPGALCDSTHH